MLPNNFRVQAFRHQGRLLLFQKLRYGGLQQMSAVSSIRTVSYTLHSNQKFLLSFGSSSSWDLMLTHHHSVPAVKCMLEGKMLLERVGHRRSKPLFFCTCFPALNKDDRTHAIEVTRCCSARKKSSSHTISVSQKSPSKSLTQLQTRQSQNSWRVFG